MNPAGKTRACGVGLGLTAGVGISGWGEAQPDKKSRARKATTIFFSMNNSKI